MKKLIYLLFFILTINLVSSVSIYDLTQSSYNNALYGSSYEGNKDGTNFKINSTTLKNVSIENVSVSYARLYGDKWVTGSWIMFKIYGLNSTKQYNGSYYGGCNRTGMTPATDIPSEVLASPNVINISCGGTLYTRPLIFNDTDYAIIFESDGSNQALAMVSKDYASTTVSGYYCNSIAQCGNKTWTMTPNNYHPTLRIYGVTGEDTSPSSYYDTNNTFSRNNISTDVFVLSINTSVYNYSLPLAINGTTYLFNAIFTGLNNGCTEFFQSTCMRFSSYKNVTMTRVNDSFFQSSIIDNELYPSYFPFNDEVIDNTVHSNYSLYNNNNIKFNVFNYSTNATYYLNLEFMGINTTSSTSQLLIYYCNNSYTTGNPASSLNCELVDSFTPQEYSHTHNNSKHQVVPVVTKNVTKSQNSTFIFINGGLLANAWNIGYITNTTYDNRSFHNGNYNVWSNTNFIYDIHLHSIGLNDYMYIYTSYYNGTAFDNSSISTFLYNIAYSKPSASNFILPFCDGTNDVEYTLGSSLGIQINWTNSTSQLNYSILYTLSVTDILLITNQQLYTGNNLGYLWNSTSWNSYLTAGNWKLRVLSTDSLGGSDTGYLSCNLYICQNNYLQYAQPCVSNVQLVSYYDNNHCNEQINFPVTNNTYTACLTPATVIALDDSLLVFLILIVLLILSTVLAITVSEFFFGLNTLLVILMGVMFNYYGYPHVLLFACGILGIVFLSMLILVKSVKK